ncbi:MAG: hypothetical protein VYB65_13180 [Myxococcota bacterium]|nr:hypothetical protein [Myxococcota bacterium]
MRLAFAAPLIVFAACGAPTEPSGQRIVTADAGTSAAPVDAGTQVTPDAGSSPVDAGAARRDTGAEADSGSAPTPDAGAPEPVDAGAPPDDSGDAPDYTGRGATQFTREELRVAASPRCTMTAVRFQPQNRRVEGYALFLHGFARGRSQFLGWGEHLASHGIEAIVSDLCFASISGVDPVAGGEAVATLIEQVGDLPVVIIGHSAGSMAALVAGVNADATVAVLGLDPVAPREGNLDEQAADLEGMLAAIAGDPSQCNSNNSGVAIYQRGSAQTLSVAQATHCDFEAPSNFLCTATCGGTGGPTVEATVRQLVTAYAAWKLGLDEAASWWDLESPALSQWIEAGRVAPVR